MNTGYPHDIYEHIDNLASAVKSAKTIDALEDAWLHFQLIESYVERTWPDDKSTIETCRRLKAGLSQYTRDVRENMPSPYSGWMAVLSSLRSQVGPRYDKDGWPL